MRLFLCALAVLLPVVAVANPFSLAQAPNEAVGLVAGAAESSDTLAAQDIADVLGDPGRVRVTLGSGSLQNLADLIYEKGIDLAIIHADVLERSLADGSIPRAETLRYVTTMFQEDVHVLARPDIRRLSDLAGRPVSAGLDGSDEAATATRLFGALHVAPVWRHEAARIGLDRLRLGEVSALVIVGSAPVPLLRTIMPGAGLHLLPVPLTPALLDTFVPSRLDAGRYPNLLDQPVDTVSAGSVLLALAAPSGSPRARRVDRFVDLLFDRFDHLREPGRFPRWRDVSLATQFPGMKRYHQAERHLER